MARNLKKGFRTKIQEINNNNTNEAINKFENIHF